MSKRIFLIVSGLVIIGVFLTLVTSMRNHDTEVVNPVINTDIKNDVPNSIIATTSIPTDVEQKGTINSNSSNREIIFKDERMAHISAQKCNEIDYELNKVEYEFWRQKYEEVYKDRRMYDFNSYCLLEDGSKIISLAYVVNNDENARGGQTIALFDPSNVFKHEIEGLFIKTLGDFVAPHIDSVKDGTVDFYFESGDGGLNVTSWYKLRLEDFMWNEYLEYFTECCNLPEYAESHIDTDLLSYVLKLKKSGHGEVIVTVSGAYSEANNHQSNNLPETLYVVQDDFNEMVENIPYYIDPIKVNDSVVVYIRDASGDQISLSLSLSLTKLEVLKKEI